MKNLVCLFFIFISINLFSLEVTGIDSLNFGAISKGKRRIHPSKGARIFIKGTPGKVVEAVFEDGMILESKGNKIKIEKITFDKEEIILDKRGKGTFRVGGIASLLEKGRPGNVNKKLWVGFKYKK